MILYTSNKSKLSFFFLALLGANNISSAVIVVYSSIQDISIPFSSQGVYLDLETATTSTFEFTGWDLNFFFGGEGIGSST